MKPIPPEHAQAFGLLNKEKMMENVANGRATDLGPNLEGQLAGTPFSETPRGLCDKMQWLIENSPYYMKINIEVTAQGWSGGCTIYESATGDVARTVDPVLIDGTVDGINLTPKRVYVIGQRMANNVINYLIDEGLTNGAG